MFSVKAEDLADTTRVKNIHSNNIVRPQKYFHYSLINSGKLDKLSSVLNFTEWYQTAPSFDHLRSCDIQIGSASMDDQSASFSLKQLRVWNTAMENDELIHWTLSTMVNQGYPNLILYYRMDNDLFKGNYSSA